MFMLNTLLIASQLATAALPPRLAQSWTYQVQKGDTLETISRKLLGDSKSWKKLIEAEPAAFPNPNKIIPGQKIVYSFEGHASDASVGLRLASHDTLATKKYDVGAYSDALALSQAARKKMSDDWKRFPKQSWESVSLSLPTEVDPLGFDSRSKVVSSPPTGILLDRIALSDKADPLGEIELTPRTEEGLVAQSIVYINADEGQVRPGQILTVTEAPERVSGSQGSGYRYLLLGRVQVDRQVGGAWQARIIQQSHPFYRGAILIPEVPEVRNIVPQRGPSSLEASILFDRHLNGSLTSAYGIVFVDRGAQDGVGPGMIFRVSQDRDGYTQDRLPEGASQSDEVDVRIADVMILHSSSGISTGVVLDATSPFASGAPATLLTDISSLSKSGRVRERTVFQDLAPALPTASDPNLPNPSGAPPKPTENEDELDRLDRNSSSGLSEAEQKELEQLEKFKDGAPAPDTLPAVPEALPAIPDTPPAPEELLPEPLPEIDPAGSLPPVPETSLPPPSQDLTPPPPEPALLPELPPDLGTDIELPPAPEDLSQPAPKRK